MKYNCFRDKNVMVKHFGFNFYHFQLLLQFGKDIHTLVKSGSS